MLLLASSLSSSTASPQLSTTRSDPAVDRPHKEEILERITRAEGKPADLDALQTLAARIKEASLCGLGQTAPNPVLTTMRYYLDEYEAHIHQKKCPAKSCTALVDFVIDPARCTGCTLCAMMCPDVVITVYRTTAKKRVT